MYGARPAEVRTAAGAAVRRVCGDIGLGIGDGIGVGIGIGIGDGIGIGIGIGDGRYEPETSVTDQTGSLGDK